MLLHAFLFYFSLWIQQMLAVLALAPRCSRSWVTLLEIQSEATALDSVCLFKANEWVRVKIRSYRWPYRSRGSGWSWKTKTSSGPWWALHGSEMNWWDKRTWDHTVTKATKTSQPNVLLNFWAQTSGPMLPSSPGVPAFPGRPYDRSQSYTMSNT